MIPFRVKTQFMILVVNLLSEILWILNCNFQYTDTVTREEPAHPNISKAFAYVTEFHNSIEALTDQENREHKAENSV